MQVITHSDSETKQLAKKISQDFKGGVIALIGDLGAGKTTFTQGFAEGLGIKERMISPTFVLMRQHPIPHTNKFLHHIDLYRLEDINVSELGLKDLFDSDDYVLIEWAEKIKNYLPKDTTWINIKKDSGDNRQITVIP